MPITTIEIQDWFDPDSPAHLAAFLHLSQTGAWPAGFIPDHVAVPSPAWIFGLYEVLALRYAKEHALVPTE
jgi:hypothetical protein